MLIQNTFFLLLSFEKSTYIANVESLWMLNVIRIRIIDMSRVLKTKQKSFSLFGWTIITKMEKCLQHIWVYKNITLTFFSLWSMSFEEAEDVICANFFKMNFFYPPRSFIHINTKWFSDPTLALLWMW